MKRQRFAPLAAGLLMTALTSLIPPGTPARVPGGIAHASRISEVQAQLDAIRAQVEETEEYIRGLLEQESVLDQEIADIIAAIRASETAIAQLSAEIRNLEAQIAETESQIADITHRMDRRQDLLRQRVRSAYMGERAELWRALLSARSLSELAARQVYLNAMARQDQQIIEGLRQDQAELDAARERLSAQEQERRAVLKEQEMLVRDLRAREDEKQTLLSRIQMDRAAAEEALQYLGEISAELERELARLIAEEQRRRNYLTFSGSFGPPLDGYLEITDYYGWRVHPIYGYESMHYGIDFAADHGDPIYAAADGEVILAEWYGGYGNAVVIDHGSGYATLYAHASALLVSKGDRVSRGDVIARVGSTGVSTGPHLHFEIRINGEAVDPLPYLQ